MISVREFAGRWDREGGLDHPTVEEDFWEHPNLAGSSILVDRKKGVALFCWNDEDLDQSAEVVLPVGRFDFGKLRAVID